MRKGCSTLVCISQWRDVKLELFLQLTVRPVFDIYNSDSEENYWTEEVYDLSEDELTTEVPKHIGNKDIYYRYDPNNNNKPEKIGTISDLVSKGDEFTNYSKYCLQSLVLHKT